MARRSRMRWHPLVVRGELNPALHEAMKERSGVYAIRKIGESQALYVGESHCGKLWRTMLRHFQAPQTFKTIGRGSFAVRHPEKYEIAFRTTSTGNRKCRAPHGRPENADMRAIALETQWIERLKPIVNREEVGEDDTSFDFGANAPESARGEEGISDWLERQNPRGGLTDVERAVLELVAKGRALADYSPPSRKPGAVARGGHYGHDIAWRAFRRLEVRGLVARGPGGGTDGAIVTPAGWSALEVRRARDNPEARLPPISEFLMSPALGVPRGQSFKVRKDSATGGDPWVFAESVRGFHPFATLTAGDDKENAYVAKVLNAFSTWGRNLPEEPAREFMARARSCPPPPPALPLRPWESTTLGGSKVWKGSLRDANGYAIGDARTADEGRALARAIIAADVGVVLRKAKVDPAASHEGWLRALVNEQRRLSRAYERSEERRAKREIDDRDVHMAHYWTKVAELAIDIVQDMLGVDARQAKLEDELRSALEAAPRTPRRPRWTGGERALLLAIDGAPYHALAVDSAPWAFDDPAILSATDQALVRVLPARGRFPERYVLTAGGSHALGGFDSDDPNFRADAREAGARAREARAAAAREKPRGYGEEEASGKKRGQLRLFASNPRGALIELGALTELVIKDDAGELVTLRWALKTAPVLAYDEAGRLFVLYPGKVTRAATNAEREAYNASHWASRAKGIVRGAIGALPPLRRLGVGREIVYTTMKGRDRELVDYRHQWGEGASGKWRAPTIAIHECGSSSCAGEGAIAIVGGTYRMVPERGIVG